MSKKKRDTSGTKSELSDFEKELHAALEFYGFLFPKTAECVERFEQLYGKTAIEAPENFEIRPVQPALNDEDVEIEVRIAAFLPPPEP